ncbi:hypothetical protein OF829_08705 [Sphingomonas sp. LB-2]|uniref:hypothetical protein n=1 Tax=Sphingomonas caeni TaxID=2984949 RepID=UPI00222F93CB|nr:hypothetical protein [Sphingomonas caeni]MCW3847320.1 hypothetical protein [Sphingomonas caeni]
MALSQSLIRLSMLVPVLLGGLALSGPVPAAAEGPGSATPYYGRWTVNEDRPVFTARGKLYKTIDIAQCGKDFCGVSVDDRGKCGAVLFRFLAKNVRADTLRGHGKWGNEQKNVVIYSYGEPEAGSPRSFELYLGDGHSFGERSGSMPKFHAEYKRTGNAKCSTR